MSAAEDEFPILTQLRQAAGNRERAGQLLKIPDFIFATHGLALQTALRDLEFAGGARFAELRELSMHEVRDANGMLSEATAKELEHWRVTLVKFAAGEQVGPVES